MVPRKKSLTFLEIFRDYKDQMSWGAVASFLSISGAVSFGVVGFCKASAYQAYALKLVYYFLGAGLVFHMISKSPELWNKYAVNIMKTRFGIDAEAGTDQAPPEEGKK